MGAPPPNHPWINGIFHYKLSSYWGTPTVGNLHIYCIISHDLTIENGPFIAIKNGDFQ